MEQIFNLKKDGVTLLKNVWDKDTIKKISDDYDKLDQTLTNQDIYKDEPIIVFWKHVVGE